jgi:hypothetical protein
MHGHFVSLARAPLLMAAVLVLVLKGKVKPEVSRQGITSNLQATSCSAGNDHGGESLREIYQVRFLMLFFLSLCFLLSSETQI